MKTSSICILIIIAAWISSCTPSPEQQSELAIDAAKARFPELTIETGKLKDHYELLRSVEISHPTVKMQLLEPKQAEYTQRIILLSNAEGDYYALPWPSLRFKSYWNYVYDTSTKPSILKGGSFQTELNKTLATLRLREDKDARKVLRELFGTLLGYRYLRQTDTADLKPSAATFKNMPDSCLDMQRKTYKSIMSGACENAFCDTVTYWGDGRLYLLDRQIKPGQHKSAYPIKVYRLPCVMDVKFLRL